MFLSEFIAMRVCIEHITALRFKLQMFGVQVDAPTNIFCNNLSVVRNSSVLSFTSNKKHSSIVYHSCQWHNTAGVICVAWVHTDDNLADAMTKRLTSEKRNKSFGSWTY